MGKVFLRSLEGKEPSYHAISDKEVLSLLHTHEKGLPDHEIEQRLHDFGFNELQAEIPVSAVKILLDQFTSPLIWILMVALAISFFLGEHIDAIVILIIIIVNAGLGFLQEYKAEKSIEALQKLVSLKATVIRDGKEQKIDSKLLVPGDIILLETGDKVPADGRLLEIYSMHTQEGPLTGESQPVTKKLDLFPEKTPLADRENMVYASTIIASGRGKAVVTTTGMRTQVGKIARLIQESHEKLTPLQKKLRSLGKYLTVIVVIVAVIVFLVGVLTGQNATVMFLTAIALAVAAIPEGLPAVITISLALGVQAMIKKNVLIRRLPSVETLGSVSVICTDKTGTLTHNQMTVVKIWVNNSIYEITGSGYCPHGTFLINKKLVNPDPLQQILKIGMLCNDAKFQGKEDNREVIGDPTEAALIVSAEKASLLLSEILKVEPRVDEIPFSSERKMMTTIHKAKKGPISYTKGSPDVVLKNCDRILVNGRILRLNREFLKEIAKQNEIFAQEALRVLAMAYSDQIGKKEEVEKKMIFVGLQAMIDPPRDEVKGAIAKCHEAGIRVIMITGDQITTAKAIATELGIKGKAVLGEEIEKIDLEKEINNIGIFARVNPEHKLQVVKVLKKQEHVVAMTGDGVNDAPALKKADIGVSMGIAGTDVAKEASDMILTDDNFTSIVNAVEEGRGIFDNIRKFVNYLLSSNLGEITAILLASLFKLPLPLTAIQLLWVNLVTDGLPATALGLDPHAKEIMKRKPRPAMESILSKELRQDILIFGVLVGIGTIILFWLYQESPLIKAQTMAFTSLVTFEIVRLYTIRSSYKIGIFSNKWLVLAVIVSILLQLATIYTPLNAIFKTTPLEWMDWGVIAIVSIVLLLLHKLYRVILNWGKKEEVLSK
ncbi:calcium-translocating P-type ATPase, SERCA-type [Candidatus Woesearchaeota archaeon]|nr:calcium-translocating P-type ATPase, SERCA-type [Candidatus Woesearchaeota archaeon]